jgi:hypothetical protein
LGLRHTLAFSFMVSDVGTGGEGWPLVDKVDPKDVCDNFPKSEYVSTSSSRYYIHEARLFFLLTHPLC